MQSWPLDSNLDRKALRKRRAVTDGERKADRYRNNQKDTG